MTVTLQTDEKILVEKTPANLFKGMEAVGGHLMITNHRLVFKSHKLNVQGGTTEIRLADIESISKASTFKIIPNRLVVPMKDGKKHKFVVYKRDQLWQLISDHLN